MVPSNIDLTENRDFGFRGPQGISFIHLALDAEDNEFVTPEEYELIRKKEYFFGKRRHDNRKREIFGIQKFIFNLESHCCRCGKEFRLPWERKRRDLCNECSEDIERTYTSPNGETVVAFGYYGYN